MHHLYARTKRWLRRAFPLPFPVRVRVLPPTHKKMEGACGWFLACEEGLSLIYIAEGPENCMAETLIEEWAHALRHAMPIVVDYEGEPHDSHFWTIYGSITNEWRARFAHGGTHHQALSKRGGTKQ